MEPISIKAKAKERPFFGTSAVDESICGNMASGKRRMLKSAIDVNAVAA